MDDHSRFAHMVNAFECSGAKSKRGAVPPAPENAAEAGENQARLVDRIRGRLVTFGDEAELPDDGEMEEPN